MKSQVASREQREISIEEFAFFRNLSPFGQSFRFNLRCNLLRLWRARGNILNVYTERPFRRQGIARRLMHIALDWCRANGIRAVILHASDDGQKLYEQLGFRSTNEMRILLD